jgi:hypothetical protein
MTQCLSCKSAPILSSLALIVQLPDYVDHALSRIENRDISSAQLVVVIKSEGRRTGIATVGTATVSLQSIQERSLSMKRWENSPLNFFFFAEYHNDSSNVIFFLLE